MKRHCTILLLLGFCVVASAQNHTSHPTNTCPTGISPKNNSSSNNKSTKSTYSCTTVNAKVLGNGVTKETCINNHSDGRVTKTTTTCHYVGASVNAGVAELGGGSKSCTKEEVELKSAKKK